MARITDPGHPGYRPELEGVEDEYADYNNPDPALQMKEEVFGGYVVGPEGVKMGHLPGEGPNRPKKKKGRR